MANASKQIVTQSLVLNKHPLTFAQLQTSEGTLLNANKGNYYRSFVFAVPSTYTHFRQTNAFVWYVYAALHDDVLFDNISSFDQTCSKHRREHKYLQRCLQLHSVHYNVQV